jgi:hypothetical protein
MAADLSPVVVGLPRRLDRRMRLGPFPSARDAMKFAAYAAAGTFALPFGGAIAWLPFLGGAFFLSVYRPDGKGLDDRAGDYLRWRWRRRRASSAPPGARARSASDDVARLPGPYLAAIVEARGIPTRFLPPADARELFDRYRTMLRSVVGGIYLDVGVATLPLTAFRLPPLEVNGPAERVAREGYEEMVRLLLRRRQRRRVFLTVFVPLRGAECVRRLDAEVGALVGHLAALGVDPERLRGSGLRSALDLVGWPPEVAT